MEWWIESSAWAAILPPPALAAGAAAAAAAAAAEHGEPANGEPANGDPFAITITDATADVQLGSGSSGDDATAAGGSDVECPASFAFDPAFASTKLTFSPEHGWITWVSSSGKRSARIGPAFTSGKHSVTVTINRSSAGNSLGRATTWAFARLRFQAGRATG
jgi:hypothetical protein